MSGFGYVLVLLTALMTMGANLMLRAGIDAAGGFAPGGVLDLVVAVVRLFREPLSSAGFVLYIVASIVWFRVVATEPLSLAYPILVSLTFFLVIAGAVAFFHEALSVQKVIGLATILAGIVIVSVEKGGS